jgi:hypothetical protein
MLVPPPMRPASVLFQKRANLLEFVVAAFPLPRALWRMLDLLVCDSSAQLHARVVRIDLQLGAQLLERHDRRASWS